MALGRLPNLSWCRHKVLHYSLDKLASGWRSAIGAGVHQRSIDSQLAAAWACRLVSGAVNMSSCTLGHFASTLFGFSQGKSMLGQVRRWASIRSELAASEPSTAASPEDCSTRSDPGGRVTQSPLSHWICFAGSLPLPNNATESYCRCARRNQRQGFGESDWGVQL